ncbi:NAD(P)-dependent oxidoreductase [Ferroglobus sp.]|uniref:NAD-dependent epimerase/dehydratase family protein n=1 Tax=Ferroglobus sp. TaxID=2614230 RepID=UPI0025C2ED75|nr:NAD-dependent epimerase/dehydratase family protein [Ferroglobus sp.]
MILVTGGNGYIGTALSKYLISEGYDFRIFDNLSGSNPLNLLYLNGKAEFVWGDVRNQEELKKAFIDVDVVIHLAAKLPTIPGLLDKVENEVRETNYFGTLNVLEMARKFDASVIFASTCNVYGVGENLTENSEPKPLNPYALSKLEAEKVCLYYHNTYGLDVKILRLASVHGYSYGVRFNLVVNFFTLRAVLGYPLTVFGDGSNWRPFIHVSDAAEAFVFFMKRGKSGEIYNVGKENFRIRDVARIVKDVVNSKTQILFDERRTPEFSYSVSFEKMRAAKFEPKVSLEDGVKELAEKLHKLKIYGRVNS